MSGSDSSSRIELRDVKEGDLQAIQAIYAHHVLTGTASFEIVPPTTEELAARVDAVRAAGLPWLVAHLGSELAGYAYASPFRARPAYRFTLESSVYVAPGAQRRGIGARLMRAVIERCEKGPWRQMIAGIGDSANAASIGLHASLGFTLAGTYKNVGFKHGRWLDVVQMQRGLGPGSSSPPDDARG